MKETMGGWIIILIPILLGALYGLKNYREEFVTEKILTFSTIGAAIFLFIGIRLYAQQIGGHFYFALLSLLGFAVSALAWEQVFKALGGITSKYRGNKTK